MSKTPEELTEEWKAKKLKTGWYYVVLSNGFIDLARLSKYGRFYHLSYSLEVKKPISIVPKYKEYMAMQEQLNKEGTWYTKISHKKLEKENNKLRRLLKECQKYIDFCCVPKGFGKSAIAEDLLTQINTALNETRANTIDCNKIQESEEK